MAAPRVLIIGRQAGAPPAGLPEARSGARYALVDDLESARAHLPDSDVVFHYGEPRDGLSSNWDRAGRLRWVHIGGVGVDWALFPDLVDSDVPVTNSRGVFDETLPEYLLALMLALVKDLPGTIRAQGAGTWRHRLLEPLAGGRVVVLGAGSIARSAARLLRAVGLTVTLVSRTARWEGPGSGELRGSGEIGRTDEVGASARVRALADLRQLLAEADWLVVLVPLTTETRGLVGARELAAMPRGARVVNIGRGPVVDESALVEALGSGALAGAALDVFETEPLPSGHPLWSMPNVIVSPHIGGDVLGTPAAFTAAFLENLERYMSGRPLHNVVDKDLGYVPSGGSSEP